MNISRYIIIISAAFLYLFLPLNPIFAQQSDATMEAEVVWIIAERQVEVMGKIQPYQKLRFEIKTGLEQGKRVEYENGTLPMSIVNLYKVGDRVILGKSVSGEQGETYYIVDVVRRPVLFWLFGLFTLVTLLVARRKAIQALIALFVSFGVIFWLVLPQILNGHDPMVVSMLAAVLIIPVMFYLSHGWSTKTHVAVTGTVLALSVTAILSTIFVNAAQLTGFASEEATFLQGMKGDRFNIRGLILAGIIIGVLGILDDVTISQAALVKELKNANPSLSRKRLFFQAMSVGTDHISSMINTLILVYAGAAMPLLLLFLDSPRPITEIINYEIVAEEIVRTLVGSIGLVLAVPLTTILAVWKFNKG